MPGSAEPGRDGPRAPASGQVPELVEVARELYELVPAQFVAARNARATQLRKAGERATAVLVAALPKATAPAWAVGAVVRERPADVEELRQLAAELRVAQAAANATELRELARRRRALTARVTQHTAALGEEHDVRLSAAARDQVAGTWHAALIDRTAARAVRSGLLVRPLQPGAVDLDAALAVPDIVAPDAAVPEDGLVVPHVVAPAQERGTGAADEASPAASDLARATDQAERELAEARRLAATAREEADAAQADLARVQAEVLQAAARVEEARRALTARETELAELDERQDAAREQHEAARSSVEDAEHEVREGRERLAALASDTGRGPGH